MGYWQYKQNQTVLFAEMLHAAADSSQMKEIYKTCSTGIHLVL